MIINIIPPEDPASEELQEQRQTVCNSCEKYNSLIDSCSECDCIIARKKFYKHSVCPIGKW